MANTEMKDNYIHIHAAGTDEMEELNSSNH